MSSSSSPSGHQLTCANHVLRVPGEFAHLPPHSAEPPRELHHTVHLHPTWVAQMGWSVDEPLLLCRRRAPAAPDADGAAGVGSAVAAADQSVSLSCCLARLCPSDPTSSSSWAAADLSVLSRPSVSLSSTVSGESWRTRAETTFAHREDEERREREERARERDAAALAAAVAPAVMKTPVKCKAKMVIVQPPSASSMARSPGPSTPSLASTLNAAARLTLRLEVHTAGAAAAVADDGEVHVLSLRQRTSSGTAARVVLQLMGGEAPDAKRKAAACTKEEEMELAAMVRSMRFRAQSHGERVVSSILILAALSLTLLLSLQVKRFLHRCFVCSDAVIDVRSLMSPALQAWKFLRIKEISPEGEGRLEHDTNIAA
jgi:hypothetical protein